MTKVFFSSQEELILKKKKKKQKERKQISILFLIQFTEAFTVIAFVLSRIINSAQIHKGLD